MAILLFLCFYCFITPARGLALLRRGRERGSCLEEDFKYPVERVDENGPLVGRRRAEVTAIEITSGGGLRSEFGASSSQLRLQTLHDAAVHLADAAFAQIERGADFLHRQFFVVVQNDD